MEFIDSLSYTYKRLNDRRMISADHIAYYFWREGQTDMKQMHFCIFLTIAAAFALIFLSPAKTLVYASEIEDSSDFVKQDIPEQEESSPAIDKVSTENNSELSQGAIVILEAGEQATIGQAILEPIQDGQFRAPFPDEVNLLRPGYSLSGWRNNETGEFYEPGNTYSFDSGITLTAEWTLSSGTVFLKDASGQLTSASLKNLETGKIYPLTSDASGDDSHHSKKCHWKTGTVPNGEYLLNFAGQHESVLMEGFIQNKDAEKTSPLAIEKQNDGSYQTAILLSFSDNTSDSFFSIAILAGFPVKFDLAGKGTSESVLEQMVEAPFQISELPQVSAHSGYRFLGWSLDGEKLIDPLETIIDRPTTYIAVYENITGGMDIQISAISDEDKKAEEFHGTFHLTDSKGNKIGTELSAGKFSHLPSGTYILTLREEHRSFIPDGFELVVAKKSGALYNPDLGNIEKIGEYTFAVTLNFSSETEDEIFYPYLEIAAMRKETEEINPENTEQPEVSPIPEEPASSNEPEARILADSEISKESDAAKKAEQDEGLAANVVQDPANTNFSGKTENERSALAEENQSEDELAPQAKKSSTILSRFGIGFAIVWMGFFFLAGSHKP